MTQLKERILSFSCQMGRLLSREWRGGCRRCLQLVCRTAATVAEQDCYRSGIPGGSKEGPSPSSKSSAFAKRRYAIQKAVLTFKFLFFYGKSEKYAMIQ